MAKWTVKWSGSAVREILNGAEVTEELQRRAEAIKKAAGDGYETSLEHTDRSRIRIAPRTAKAFNSNLKHNTLLKAVGAGRK